MQEEVYWNNGLLMWGYSALGAHTHTCEDTYCGKMSLQCMCTQNWLRNRHTQSNFHTHAHAHTTFSQHSIPYCLLLMGNLSNDISFTVERKLNHVVSDCDYDYETSLLFLFMAFYLPTSKSLSGFSPNHCVNEQKNQLLKIIIETEKAGRMSLWLEG